MRDLQFVIRRRRLKTKIEGGEEDLGSIYFS